jgi:hypothetical protein
MLVYVALPRGDEEQRGQEQSVAKRSSVSEPGSRLTVESGLEAHLG